jgi:hypothetical protein
VTIGMRRIWPPPRGWRLPRVLGSSGSPRPSQKRSPWTLDPSPTPRPRPRGVGRCCSCSSARPIRRRPPSRRRRSSRASAERAFAPDDKRNATTVTKGGALPGQERPGADPPRPGSPSTSSHRKSASHLSGGSEARANASYGARAGPRYCPEVHARRCRAVLLWFRGRPHRAQSSAGERAKARPREPSARRSIPPTARSSFAAAGSSQGLLGPG